MDHGLELIIGILEILKIGIFIIPIILEILGISISQKFQLQKLLSLLLLVVWAPRRVYLARLWITKKQLFFIGNITKSMNL